MQFLLLLTRAVDFVVGRGGKQSLDLFLLGKYRCRVGDLQVTVMGLCLSPSEGCEILISAVSPFLLPRFLCIIHHTLFYVACLPLEQME